MKIDRIAEKTTTITALCRPPDYCTISRELEGFEAEIIHWKSVTAFTKHLAKLELSLKVQGIRDGIKPEKLLYLPVESLQVILQLCLTSREQPS